MEVRDEIINFIENIKLLYVPIEGTSDLYRDLNFDSLEFIQLLLSIEDIYAIKFSLVEMDKCLKVEQLIAIVEKKTEGAGDDQTFINEPEE